MIMTDREEKNWVVFCHLGGLIPFCFLNLIIPLSIWLTQKSKSDYINNQGLEIVNFQISIVIYGTGLLLLAFTVIGIPITVMGFIFLGIFNFISVIRGAIAGGRGDFFSYPLNLRLLK
jgi:hypothetical protein